MTHRVLVVGHADADGHLIAEQTRRNLDVIDTFDVTLVVDPERTKDHKSWMKLDAIEEIESADLIFFVDLMFAPATFSEEAKALVNFVQDRPEKQFFLIDHHPLPLRRLEPAKNLRALYRPDVFECAIGPRSGMMVVAALCENQGSRVADIKQPAHDILALGMRRAAAHGGELPGKKLLALLKSDCWQPLAQLGTEDREYHRLPRGRRPLSQPQSRMLKALNATATELLAQGNSARESRVHRSRGSAMAYDFDVGQERFFPNVGEQRSRSKKSRNVAKDLEVIVTLLEVAALSLTIKPGDTFTREELIREAREIGGSDVDLDKRDVQIVLDKSTFVEKVAGGLRLR